MPTETRILIIIPPEVYQYEEEALRGRCRPPVDIILDRAARDFQTQFYPLTELKNGEPMIFVSDPLPNTEVGNYCLSFYSLPFPTHLTKKIQVYRRIFPLEV